MIADEIISGIDEGFLYSNDEPYYKVWSGASINSEYFIYLQEDFVLYDDVDEDKINEYVTFLKDNPEYSFVRLLRASSFKQKKLTDTLYEIESSNKNVFSMQPTIWRSHDYIKLSDSGNPVTDFTGYSYYIIYTLNWNF